MMHQVDVQHMLNSISMNRQQISPPVGTIPPVPTIPQQSNSQNNSFQSLIMQLHSLQKPHLHLPTVQQVSYESWH